MGLGAPGWRGTAMERSHLECTHCCRATDRPPDASAWWVSGVPAVVAALLPKCPMCLLAYGGLFASVELGRVAAHPLLAIGLAALSIAALTFYARRAASFTFVIVVAMAMALLLLARVDSLAWVRWLGFAGLTLGYVGELVRRRRLRAALLPHSNDGKGLGHV